MTLVSALEEILEKGVAAVIPSKLINATICPVHNGVRIFDKEFTHLNKLNVFGFGKTAMSFVKETVKILGLKIDNVVCCSPQPTEHELANFSDLFSWNDNKSVDSSKPNMHMFYGLRNNEPNNVVVDASLKMARIASKMKAGDLLLVCITGGGSALLTLPSPLDPCSSALDPSCARLKLESIIETTKLLSLNGAPIRELNSVRSCLDCIKAGGLARFAAPAQVVSLILSDVVGDPIRFIAGGPTWIDPEVDNGISPFYKAISILKKYDLINKIPLEVKNFLFSGQSTGKKPPQVEPKPVNYVIGNAFTALEAAACEAAKSNPSCLQANRTFLPFGIFRRTPVESFEYILPIILTDKLEGDMTEKADAIADLSWELREMIEFFLTKPDYTSRHVTDTVRERLKAAQKRVTDKKEYYRDLVHACYLVAKAANELMPSETRNEDHFLSGVCLLFGGEATVKIGCDSLQHTERSVNGGRCSHAALAAGLRWFDLRDGRLSQPQSRASTHIVFFARASDGLDGPSAFGAGAWSTEELIRDAQEAAMARQYLGAGDSYGFFVNSQRDPEMGHFLPARLTGTNVMDLFMCTIGVYA